MSDFDNNQYDKSQSIDYQYIGNEGYTYYDSDNKSNDEPDPYKYLKLKLRGNRRAGAFFLLFGLALIIAGIWSFQRVQESSSLDVPKNATEVTTDGEYVTDTMTCLTDPFAAFSLAEDHVICIAYDEDSNPFHFTVVCIKESEIDTYIDYIHRTYYVDAPKPDTYELRGYSYLIGDELKGYIIDALYDIFQDDFTEEIYENYVLPIYIVVGDAKAEYSGKTYSTELLAVGFLFFIVGVYLIINVPPVLRHRDDYTINGNFKYLILGTVGACIGTIFGGTIWVLCGLSFEYFMFLSILLPITAHAGYSVFCTKHFYYGIILCTIIPMIMIFLGVFAIAVIQAYTQLNGGYMGYATIPEAILSTYRIVIDKESRGDFLLYVITSEATTLCFNLFMFFVKKPKRNKSVTELNI